MSSRSLASALLALAVRALAATWRVRQPDPTPLTALDQGPVVIAFLHGQQLPLIATHRHLPILGMASLSRDGQLLADTIARLGYAVVRGSSSSGGKDALRLSGDRMAEGLSPALAVDGPRGPAGHVHTGAARLALEQGRPVLCMWARVGAAIHLRSWDRFCIPLPFARVALHYRIVPAEGDVGTMGASIRAALSGGPPKEW